MNYDIKNKIVLFTGANCGIGKALVEAFVEHGAAKVYATVRTLESASLLVEKYGVVSQKKGSGRLGKLRTPTLLPHVCSLSIQMATLFA